MRAEQPQDVLDAESVLKKTRPPKRFNTPRYLRPGRPATKIRNKVLPSYVYHVTQRGTDRQNVFRQAGDRDVYLDLLRDQRQDAGVSLQTYCSGGSTGDMRNLSTRATAAPDTMRVGIRGQARRPTPKV